MKRLLASALIALLAMLAPMEVAQAATTLVTTSVSYRLLANTNKTGVVVPNLLGGVYQVDLEGTLGGTSVTVKVSGADGVLRTQMTLSSTGINTTLLTVPAGGSVQAVVTGGSPSALYLQLGGIGSAGGSSSSGGGAISGPLGTQSIAASVAETLCSGCDVTEGSTGDAANAATVLGQLKQANVRGTTFAPAAIALNSSTATQVLATLTNPNGRGVCNADLAITEYIGSSGVTAATGIPVLPQGCYDLSHTSAAIYSISQSGTPNMVGVQY